MEHSAGGEHRKPTIPARLRLPPPRGAVIGRWRILLVTRLVTAAAVVGLEVMAFLLVFGGAERSDRIAGAAMVVLWPLLWWLFFGRPYMTLTDEQVVIRNPVVGYVVPLEAVKSAEATGWGVALKVSGRDLPIVAMAVPKANISILLNKLVRGDEVAAAITTTAHNRGSSW